MPIYEYQCDKCGHKDSEIESFDAPRRKKCPRCGKRSFARLISAASFHLKGGGWYATDFRDKKKSAADKADKAEKPDKKEKAESKPDKKPESAPAPKEPKAAKAENRA